MLRNVLVFFMCRQVLQPLLLHGLFPFLLVPSVMEREVLLLNDYVGSSAMYVLST